MSKIKKIINTVAIFIVIMFVICFVFSLYKVLVGDISISEIFSETGLYFLYTVGYGALEGDSVIQNILAMIGIIALALMSTYLTINLFWRLDDVKLNKKILYNKDSLRISFLNKGRAICDMKATFLLYDREKCENILEPKEYYMPMLVSDSYWHLTLDLNETFWYKAVYGLVTNSNKNLYCIYSFVDTNSGQSSIRVTEITKDYFDNLNYVEFTKDYVLSNKDLLPIENGGKLNLERINNYTKLTYSFKRKDSDNSFVMLYYNFYEKFLNLEKYDKSNTYLLLDIKGIDVTIKFEIKLSNNVNVTRVINVDNELVKIYLEDITESLENVKEICYTIFKSDNKLNGKVEIGDLKIITK